MFNNLVEMLQNAAEFSKSEVRKVTFINEKGHESSMSYSELNDESLRIAYSLMDLGLKKGDRVLFQFATIEYYIKMFWACMYCGAVPMKLIFSRGESANKLVLEKQMKICEKVDHLYLFTEQAYCTEYNKLLKDTTNTIILSYEEICTRKVDCEKYKLPVICIDDDALVLYSSGSTKLSKGVLHTQGSVLESVIRCIERNNHGSQDRMLSFLPITHAFGFFGFHLMPIACCCDHYLMPASIFIKDSLGYLKRVEDYKLTILSGMNFALEIFVNSINKEDIESLDLSTVKHYYIAGEPVNADVVKHFLDIFSVTGFSESAIRPLYGMSEGGLGLTMASYKNKYRVDYLERDKFYKDGYAQLLDDTANSVKFVSMGKPIEGLEVRVMNDAGEILKDNEIGELYFKGKSLFKKYLNIEDEEDKNLVDGFLGSGDMGYLSNGELIVTGRKKDMIIVNGQNYFPLDLELLIGSICEEIKSNVVAVQVFDLCNRPHNYVFIKYNKSIEEFIDLAYSLKQELKKQVSITFDAFIPISELPRTGTGKLKRADFQKEYVGGKYDDIIDEMNRLMKSKFAQRDKEEEDKLYCKIQEVWKKVLIMKNAKCDSYFDEFVSDSLVMLQFVFKINEMFDINVELKEIMSAASLHEATEIIRKSIANK